MKETWSRSGGSCCATLAATASCTQRCMRHQSPVGPSRAQNETMKVMGEMTTINKEQNNHTSPPFAECKNAGVTLCTCSRFDDARHCHADAATLCGMSGEAIRVLLTIAREERTGHTWRGQSTREMKQGGWQHSEQQLAGCMTARSLHAAACT